MATQIEVCNFAIAQVKGRFIESLDEASTEAGILNRMYDSTRDALLADIEPSWARKQIALALLTETSNAWSFVYAYPADCLRASRIFNPASDREDDKVPFEIGLADSGSAKVVLTEEENAELIYTAKVTNTGVYDFLFVEALFWKLAGFLAVPLKGDDKLQATCARAYAAALGNAKASTKNEAWKTPTTESSFQKAR